VARLRDWIDLGKSTWTSLTTSDVTNLYVVEWPETRKMLVAEHRSAIENEPRRAQRWLLTTSAIFYGLAKRLAPHRRILFFGSFVVFFISLIVLADRMADPPFWIFVEVAAAFIIMTALLAMELIDKLKFRDELQLARDLQASLIPHEMPRTEEYANTVGGDIYDFVPLPDGRLAVLFGDASGHGMAAGLVMAVAHASFRTQLEVDPSPAAIIGSLNRILCRTGGSRSFFSCVYLLFSPDGFFLATVAGHPPVLKLDRNGRIAERIGAAADALGVKSGLTWETVGGTLAPGDRLLLHSDGLTEARNQYEQEFGDAYVETIASWHPASDAASLVNSLVSEWRTFMGPIAPEDDVSITVILRK
jgi:serine phosphatase RsbU (regulator of sigma subunit)